MTFCMISFGPVKDQSNGYFIRCYQIAKCLEQLDNVLVLEFPGSSQQQEFESDNRITFIRLKGNEVDPNGISKLVEIPLTFNVYHQLRFQLHSLIHLWAFRRHIKSCRVVFVEGALIPFAIVLSRLLGKKVVLDTHAVNKRLALSYRKHKKTVFLIRTLIWHALEYVAFILSNYLIFVSEEEKNFSVSDYNIPRRKAFVVNNFQQCAEEGYSNRDVEDLRLKWRLKDKIVVAFVGDLTSVQNKDAVDYVLEKLAPHFLRRKPETAFLIIGKGKESFRHDLPNVIFTGYVKHVSPLLELSDVYIAPLRVGCGVKTKVLQYLAHGKPIVTTPVGIEGIDLEEPNAIITSDISAFENSLIETIRILGSLKKVAVYNKRIFERKYSLQPFQTSLKRCVDHVTKDF